MNNRVRSTIKASQPVQKGMLGAPATDIRPGDGRYLDYVSSTFIQTLPRKRPVVIILHQKSRVTLLPLPTGRHFSEKFFTFIAPDSKLAHFLLDNRL